jgi:putative transposase
MVAPDGGALAGLARRFRAVEDGVQPVRSLVEDREVDPTVSKPAVGPRRRVAQHRQHDQPRSPARVRRKGGLAAEGIGRSRGGLSTKVHLVVDALGLPLTFEITEGQRHDIRPAKELVARVMSQCLLADKAYDSDDFRNELRERNCVPVIPSNGSRAEKLPYAKELYKARSEVECTFSLLKQARRFATRYEKTLRNYAAVVAIGCALLWLRV